jgi:hypothetical protein
MVKLARRAGRGAGRLRALRCDGPRQQGRKPSRRGRTFWSPPSLMAVYGCPPRRKALIRPRACRLLFSRPPYRLGVPQTGRRIFFARALRDLQQGPAVTARYCFFPLRTLRKEPTFAHAGSTCRSTRTGSVKANVEPWPTCDSTQILPPCISMMRFDMASPKPVPPFLRVMALSAC